MATNDDRPDRIADEKPERADPRPAYEPPRIVKKRSVSRATLFTGSGPTGGAPGGGLVANG